MRKIYLLLALILTMIFLCACSSIPAGGKQEETETSENEWSVFNSQREFEDYIRQGDALPAHYIPWQTILPFGRTLNYVVVPDPYNSYNYGYSLRDESWNDYSVSVLYEPDLYGKNVWDFISTFLKNDEPTDPIALTAYLSSEDFETANGPSRYYVDNVDDPKQVYYYEDDQFKAVAFIIDNFEIVVRTDLLQSAGNTIPQMFTSYSELQTGIENIRENVAQYIAKSEAAE